MSAHICPVCHTQHDTTACPSITVSYHEVADKLQNDYLSAQAWEIDIRADERAKVLKVVEVALEANAFHTIRVGPLDGPLVERRCILLDSAQEIIIAILGEQKGEENGKG